MRLPGAQTVPFPVPARDTLIWAALHLGCAGLLQGWGLECRETDSASGNQAQRGTQLLQSLALFKIIETSVRVDDSKFVLF